MTREKFKHKADTLDPMQIEEAASKMLSVEEIGSIFKVSPDTLMRHFAEAIQNGRNRGKATIRRAQWDKAINEKDRGMLVWLGKQYLGQSEKIIHAQDNALVDKTDHELERIVLEAAEQLKNGTRLIPSSETE
jgi:AraC-like DNA-binding protein